MNDFVNVSICIPTYNGEKYLRECLESVCAQATPGIEIVVCDDCSNDNTVGIVKKFQSRDPRIRLNVNERNLGLVGNWNRCIELANGKWIKYVFQDDLLSTNAIEKFLALATDGVEMVVCERTFLFENNVNKDVIGLYERLTRLRDVLPQSPEAQHVSISTLSQLVHQCLPENFIGEPTSLMFTKACIEKYGLFDTRIIQMVDFEFAVRVGLNNGLVYTPEELVKFRVHGAATSQFNNSKKQFATIYEDVIALYYALQRDHRYLKFREELSLLQRLRFHWRLYYRVHRALHYVRKSPERNNLQNDFNRLKTQFPGIDRYSKLRLLFRGFDAAFTVRDRIALLINDLRSQSHAEVLKS